MNTHHNPNNNNDPTHNGRQDSPKIQLDTLNDPQDKEEEGTLNEAIDNNGYFSEVFNKEKHNNVFEENGINIKEKQSEEDDKRENKEDILMNMNMNQEQFNDYVLHQYQQQQQQQLQYQQQQQQQHLQPQFLQYQQQQQQQQQQQYEQLQYQQQQQQQHLQPQFLQYQQQQRQLQYQQQQLQYQQQQQQLQYQQQQQQLQYQQQQQQLQYQQQQQQQLQELQKKIQMQYERSIGIMGSQLKEVNQSVWMNLVMNNNNGNNSNNERNANENKDTVYMNNTNTQSNQQYPLMNNMPMPMYPIINPQMNNTPVYPINNPPMNPMNNMPMYNKPMNNMATSPIFNPQMNSMYNQPMLNPQMHPKYNQPLNTMSIAFQPMNNNTNCIQRPNTSRPNQNRKKKQSSINNPSKAKVFTITNPNEVPGIRFPLIPNLSQRPQNNPQRRPNNHFVPNSPFSLNRIQEQRSFCPFSNPSFDNNSTRGIRGPNSIHDFDAIINDSDDSIEDYLFNHGDNIFRRPVSDNHDDDSSPMKEVIKNSLPEFYIKDLTTLDEEKRQCSICLCAFTTDIKVLSLPCLHFYHKECILPWFNKDNTCPLCKMVINDEIFTDKQQE